MRFNSNAVDTQLPLLKMYDPDGSMSLRAIADIFNRYGQFFKEQNANVLITSSIQKNVMLLGLPDRIARVFINLIENAISFAGENGQVCITLQKSWRYGIIVTVQDSGPGVPEASRDDIFERFFSARQGSALRENSSGLGLYICKQVVEAHEGIITVLDSDVHGGASFQVRF